jgi:hypothetical protein
VSRYALLKWRKLEYSLSGIFSPYADGSGNLIAGLEQAFAKTFA